MEPGRVPCALKCTLILTSDLFKGWYGLQKKLVTHVRSGPISAILKSKMAAIQNLIFSKNDAYMVDMYIIMKLLARRTYIRIIWINVIQ